MKKVKVIIREWECKEVEYICEVEEDNYKMGKDYGIGYLDGSDLQTDAEGFDAIPISKKVLDDGYEFKSDVVEWKIIKEN